MSTGFSRIMLSAFFAVCACTAEDGPATRAEPSASGETPIEQPSKLAGSSWVLQSLDGRPATGVSPDSGGRQPPGIEFGQSHAGGFSGCNAYGGLYVQDGSILQFGDIVANEMGCVEAIGAQEQALFALLRSSVRTMMKGDRLILTGGDHRAELARRDSCQSCEHQKPSQAMLSGPNWRIRSVDGDYVDNFYNLPEQSAFLQFEDGDIRYTMGCNLYRGSFGIEANRLIAGSFASTKRGCSGAVGRMEAKVQAILSDRPAISFGHNHDVLIGSKAGRITAEIYPLPQDK